MSAAAAMNILHDVALAKIRPPKPTSMSIERDHLLEKLVDALAYRVVTVEAPRGYAKTGFLAESHRRLGADRGRWRCAWMSADEGDNPERLCRHVLESWRAEIPDLDPDELMPIYRENPEGYTVIVSNYLASGALETGVDYVMFVDNLDKAEPSAVRELLNSIAEYFPENFHLVASGNYGLWESLDLRYRDQVHTIEGADLSFSPDEVASLLQRAVERGRSGSVSQELVDGLVRITAGWPLAVRSYADLVARGVTSASETVDERALAQLLNRFFRESVLDSLPDDLRDFVIVTALPDRMNAELADALSGRDDSRFVLRELRVRGCYVERAADDQDWYEYHPLFHRWLRRKQGQMDPQRLRDLCRTTSDWFAQRGQRAAAAKYMLMESDSSFVEALASAVGYDSPRNGMAHFDWVAATPAHRFEELPRLALQAAWGYICSGRVKDALGWVDVFEACASGPDASTVADLVKIKGLEMECRYEEAVREGEGYLASQGERLSLQQRCLLTHALAESYTRIGRFDDALKNYLQAEVMAELGKSSFFVALCRMGIIWLRIAQGEFNSAFELSDKALDECPRSVAAYGALLSVRAYLCLETGRLDEASVIVARAEEALLSTRNIDMLYEANAVSAQCLASLGQGAQAFRLITKTALTIGAERVARSVNLLVYLIQARVSLAMGYLSEAANATSALKNAAGARDVVYRLAARTLEGLLANASGSPMPDQMFEGIGQAADAGLKLYEMELCICMADCLAQQGSRTDALMYMNRALRLQAGQHIVGPFLRSGTQTRSLLHEIVDVRKSGGQARQLAKAVLREFGANEPEEETVEQASGPQARFGLTERECEVLELLDEGLSRREIAEALTVSINTVKSHVSSIYAKLGVTNRIDAFAVVHGE